MAWAAFSHFQKTEMVILKDHQDPRKHKEPLSKNFLPFTYRSLGTEFIFQQDNAVIHAPAITKQLVSHLQTDVMEWLALNLNVNPIENPRGILVYEDVREFRNWMELIQGRKVQNRGSSACVHSLLPVTLCSLYRG